MPVNGRLGIPLKHRVESLTNLECLEHGSGVFRWMAEGVSGDAVGESGGLSVETGVVLQDLEFFEVGTSGVVHDVDGVESGDVDDRDSGPMAVSVRPVLHVDPDEEG